MNVERGLDAQLLDARRRLTEAEAARDSAFAVVRHMQSLARTLVRVIVGTSVLLLLGVGTAIVDGLLVPQSALTPLPELSLVIGLFGLFVATLFYFVARFADDTTSKAYRTLAMHEGFVRGTRAELDMLLGHAGRSNDD